MARIHSYVVEHDYGFAPNPFWGTCTLAFCKPIIRKVADQEDWIVGTGSAADKTAGRLIYWMRVARIIHFDQYWNAPEFGCKKPVLNGSTMQQFGDNIYHTGSDGEIYQVDSFHSQPNGVLSPGNMRRDIGVTDRVLIGGEFAYFGKNAPLIPEGLAFVAKRGPGHKSSFSENEQSEILSWLVGMPERGFIEEPVRW